MNRKSVLWILLDLIFLVVFNTVFFTVGGLTHPVSVWIAYGFIHLSYLMVLITPFLIRKSSSAAVFGLSLYSISSAYFLVEFVVGLIFIFLKSGSYKLSLVVQVILAGLYGVLLLSHLIANEHTADKIERHEDEVIYIKAAALRVKGLIGKLNDKKANKVIEKLYDLLHASPVRSVASVRPLELKIEARISALEDAVSASDVNRTITMADEVISLTEERNRKIRLAK